MPKDAILIEECNRKGVKSGWKVQGSSLHLLLLSGHVGWGIRPCGVGGVLRGGMSQSKQRLESGPRAFRKHVMYLTCFLPSRFRPLNSCFHGGSKVSLSPLPAGSFGMFQLLALSVFLPLKHLPAPAQKHFAFSAVKFLQAVKKDLPWV